MEIVDAKPKVRSLWTFTLRGFFLGIVFAEVLRSTMALGPIASSWTAAAVTCLSVALIFRTLSGRAPSPRQGTLLLLQISMLGVLPYVIGSLISAYSGSGTGISVPLTYFMAENVLPFPAFAVMFIVWARIASGGSNGT